MHKISVAIITYNEEKNIARCLDSVESIADEIIVVDSFSQDKTKEICLSYENLRFEEHPFEGHIQQKNVALNLCQYDLVLSLDADEALSETLLESIKEVKKTPLLTEGFSFNRLTNYNGFWVRYCGWYPDTKLRLVKKDRAQWEGVNPHDILRLKGQGKVQKLKGDLLHYSYDSISDHINQTNKFTTIAAREAFERGVRSSTAKILSRTFYKFIRDYFFKRGFLDGHYGLVICTINALSSFLKYSKIKELQKGKSI